MAERPSETLAAVLGFLVPPIGMLYAGHAAMAIGLLFALFGIGVLEVVYLHRFPHAALVLAAVVHVAGGVLAHRIVRAFPDDGVRPAYSRWPVLAGAFLALSMLVLVMRAYVTEPFQVPTSSMAPSIAPGSNVVVDKWGYGQHSTYGVDLPAVQPLKLANRGDMVVFISPLDAKQSMVSRVVGLPGDRLQYRDKLLRINGEGVPVTVLGKAMGDRFAAYEVELREERIGGRHYQIQVLDEPATELPRLSSSPLFAQNCAFAGAEFDCSIPPGHYFLMSDNRDQSVDSRVLGFVPQANAVGVVTYVFR